MPLRIGLLVYPLFAVAIAVSRGGVVSKFVRAGAVSPETARKAASLSIIDVDGVRSAAKRGLLVDVGGRRYYVNMTKYRRRQQLVIAALVLGGVVIGGLTILAFLPGLL